MSQNAFCATTPPLASSTSGDVFSIVDRLKANQQVIDRICEIAGIAGASIGVIHEGQIIYKYHHGFQNIATGERANDNTLYGIGSCSKPLFSAVAAALVAEGRLKRDEPVKRRLPNFETSSRIVTETASLIDLLAHRTGLTGGNWMTFQSNVDHLIQKKDFWEYLTTIKPAASLRERWIYSSTGYSIAAEVMTRVTGKSPHTLLQDYVSKPLGLTRTITELDFDNEPNFAKPYSALADGTPYELPKRQDFRGHFFEAAAGVYSTLNDMLKFLQVNLDAIHLRESDGPLKETATIFSQHIPVLNPSFRERSYALGWIRTQLPGVAGVMGDNIDILGLSGLPVIGEGTQSRLCLYHQGSTVGYYPALYMFPETRSGIVVLTNSIALGDQADWIAQCLTQGQYWDESGLFHISISHDLNSDGNLKMAFQGRYEHTYELRHYHDDVFEWTLTRDETAKRMRYHIYDLKHFLMEFRGKNCEELVWHDDGGLPTPRVLKRKAPVAICKNCDYYVGVRTEQGAADAALQSDGPSS
ncbi:beta-lactamase/transpeptidase-like protein [Naviculisporaceae sp. PSN 640]